MRDCVDSFKNALMLLKTPDIAGDDFTSRTFGQISHDVAAKAEPVEYAHRMAAFE